jgi:hypothetical protein
MRDFAGVENVVRPGLAEQTLEALFALAERTRVAQRPAQPGLTHLVATPPSAPLSR